MDCTRFRIVENAETDDERERRRVPELKQRPEYRDADEDLLSNSCGLASAGVRLGYELLEIDIWSRSVSCARHGGLPSGDRAVQGAVAPCIRVIEIGGLLDPAFFLVILLGALDAAARTARP